MPKGIGHFYNEGKVFHPSALWNKINSLPRSASQYWCIDLIIDRQCRFEATSFNCMFTVMPIHTMQRGSIVILWLVLITEIKSCLKYSGLMFVQTSCFLQTTFFALLNYQPTCLWTTAVWIERTQLKWSVNRLINLQTL